MKCPLKHTLVEATAEKRTWRDDNCLEEKCAWWHKATARCLVATISTDIDRIALHLSSIVDTYRLTKG